jgi:hypothetical protein
MKNYTFIKPFKTTIGSKDVDARLIGAVPFQEINFKIGDKVKIEIDIMTGKIKISYLIN